MAATGYTPIYLYYSSTTSNVPSAGNLGYGELAINITDKNLFFKDNGNVVNTVPIRQSSGSSNGWLSSTDWNTFNNKQPAGTYVTSVTGTAPVVSSGGSTPAISLSSGYGDTQNPYASKTANYVLAAPNGTAGVPTFRALVAADIPTLNQNTTGSSGSCTGNAATATTLQTARTINGVSFNGSANITVTADASTLTGTTLKSTVTASSLTSVGTLSSLTVSGTASIGSVNLTSTTLPTNGWYLPAANTMALSCAGVQKWYITSTGNFFINCTSIPGAGTSTIGSNLNPNGYISTYRSAGTPAYFGRTNDGEVMALYSGTTQRGTVSIAGATTTYGSVSDYRLKENVTEIANGLNTVLALKPSQYNFKEFPETINHGFVAHELQAIIPEAVNGEKDAVNDAGKPDYQFVDMAKIVPFLVKAIQEQQKIIEQLKSKLGV